MKKFIVILVLLLAAAQLSAQTTKVIGTVHDAETGEPVPFAGIYFKDTTIGLTADIDGKFTIETRDPNAKVLVCQLLGYEPQEIAVKQGAFSHVEFKLVISSNQLPGAFVKADNRRIRRLLANIDAHRDKNDPDQRPSFTCNIYNKIELDLSRPREVLTNKRFQKEFGFTIIFVTHDQSEAMALSDKIIIMNGGHIEQVGSPTEIYQYPVSHFVADFIGSANFVPARVKSISSKGTRLESKAGPGLEIGTALVEMFGQEFTVKCIQGELAAGDTVEVVIRPEAIELADDGDVKAEVESSTYMGQMQDYVVKAGGQELATETYNPSSKKVYRPGDTVYLRIQRESLHAIKK